jgi:hypothetical protein
MASDLSVAAMRWITFFDASEQRMRKVALRTATGLQGRAHRLTVACNDYAIDNGYTHWVQPDLTTQRAELEWLVFETDARRHRLFLKRLPTREAAEMWLLHHVM